MERENVAFQPPAASTVEPANTDGRSKSAGDDSAYQTLLAKAADLRRLNMELNRQGETISTAANEMLSAAGAGSTRPRSSLSARSDAAGRTSSRGRSSSASAAKHSRQVEPAAAASTLEPLDHTATVAAPSSHTPRDRASPSPRAAGSVGRARARGEVVEDGGNLDAGADPERDLTEGIGNEALVRIQKARINVLQKQLADAMDENKTMSKQLSSLEGEVRGLTDEKRKLAAKVKTLETTLEKENRHKAEGEAATQQRAKQVDGLERELSATKKALRQLESEGKNREVRLNRALEEVERLKAALAAEKNSKRSDTAQERKEVDKLEGDVRKLERQKSELLTAFRKQMKLIDVLKRQKLHLEAARLLSFTEDEMSRCLGAAT